MSDRLAGKGVIVTGAAGGIGLATARALLREGARVLINDRNPAVEAAAAEIGAAAMVFDVSDALAWAGCVAEAERLWGRIDGLVNNAAIEVKGPPFAASEADWDLAFNVNLKAMWLGARAVAPLMLAQKAGVIVNLGSVHGLKIIPGGFPYSVTKSGVLGLTRALGVEYARAGVRVVALAPGYIDSDPSWWAQAPAGAREEAEALIPAGRLGHVDEVAMTIVFLMSDEARFITATTIEIDGGQLAQFHP